METISAYFSNIRHNKALTAEQEVELSKIILAGGPDAQVAIDKLVNANLKFAVSIARQYQGRGIALEDLINEANIGLIKAAQRYDGTTGFRFITYAVHWIKQSILESCFKVSRPVRLPLNQVSNLSKINKVLSEIEQTEGRIATTVELSRKTGLTEHEVESLLQVSRQAMSLDKTIDGDEEECGSLVDLIAGDSFTGTEAEEEDLHTALINILKATLNEREYTIISESFGLEGVAKELEVIAENLNVTAERIRQLQKSALMKLRKGLSREQLREFLG